MATYKHSFIKMTLNGSLANGQDIFNCGINLAVNNDTPDTEADLLNERLFKAYVENRGEAIKTSTKEFWTNIDMDIPAGVKLEYIKFSLVGRDGKVSTEPAVIDLGSIAGSLSTAAYVPQISSVITLQSNKWRDPGKYNRFYLPVAAPNGNGQWKISDTQAKAETTAKYLKTLKATVTDMDITNTIVPAAVSSSDKIKGNFLPITTVKVGDLYDTQRRRRNAINEQYLSAPVNY
jgi:hypothetical protein